MGFFVPRSIALQPLGCRNGFFVADSTLQLFGGAGYRKDWSIERIWREVRAIRILEGTSEIMRHIVARDMLLSSMASEIPTSTI
jgi:alkylation response protein AidB-like acyl-CoA dehydrogenase